ncbi:hypothetical protein LTR84_004190 [Exophiala bonariae]|uniref:HTH myb-type domain-containing protein n=1 Tax=Exophiala bonariae TaxID=1690606 RepID=A0AAV9N6E5_9EURO|nr:hypothetical protein LTR84_004190 [Exophiala bonariae]
MVGSNARPGTRDLVRWNEELDKGLLLTIQYACGEAGIKLPWARIAEVMGPKFSEGSITQHLAKIRKKMAEHGIPVPPALKRGYVAKAPSKIYGAAGSPSNLTVPPVTPLYADTPKVGPQVPNFYGTPMTPAGGGDDYDQGTPSRAPTAKATIKARARARAAAKPGKGKGKGVAGQVAMSDEDEDDGPMPELYDSDEEFKVPRKKLKLTTRKPQANKPDNTLSQVKVEKNGSPTVFNTMAGIPAHPSPGGSADIVPIIEPVTPRQTRGVKRDYSMMGDTDESDNNASDEGETVCVGDGEEDEDEDDGGDGDQLGAAIANPPETITRTSGLLPVDGMFPDVSSVAQQDFHLPFEFDYNDPLLNNLGYNAALHATQNAPLNFNASTLPTSMGGPSLTYNSFQQNMANGMMGGMTPSMFPLHNIQSQPQPMYGGLLPSASFQSNIPQASYGNFNHSASFPNFVPQSVTYPGTPAIGTMGPPPIPFPASGSSATDMSGMTVGTNSRQTSIASAPLGPIDSEMTPLSSDEFKQMEQVAGEEREKERAWAHHQAGGEFDTYLQGGSEHD